MKILRRRFKKWGQGYVKMIPIDDEDLWHIYNLIQNGDHIMMKSRRKIIDDSNVTGLKKVRAKVLNLTLLIVDIDYYAQGDRLAISIKGRNAKQNQYLKIGQYHTFCVELETQITIYKEIWSHFQMRLVKELSGDKFGVQIAAMVMDEGIAHLCYIKSSITLLKQKIEKNISKKSCGEQIYRKSLGKFLAECSIAIRSVDFESIKCFVLASPGFLNEQLLKYLEMQSQKGIQKINKKVFSKFLLVKCSTGYMNSLNEVLSDPIVMNKMQNTKAINQTALLNKFYTLMQKNQKRVTYGENDVIRCVKMQAVQTMLIGDHLFRTKDFKKRKIFNQISEDVKKYGGETVIFSSLHPSGEKLKNITGIAAILRFDVEPLDEDEDDQQQPKLINNEGQEDQNQKMDNFDLKKLQISDDQDSQDN